MEIIFDNGKTKIIKKFETNMTMTLDAIIEHFGEIINDANDERFSDDGDNVIIDGERFWYEDIEKSWNENTDIED